MRLQTCIRVCKSIYLCIYTLVGCMCCKYTTNINNMQYIRHHISSTMVCHIPVLPYIPSTDLWPENLLTREYSNVPANHLTSDVVAHDDQHIVALTDAVLWQTLGYVWPSEVFLGKKIRRQILRWGSWFEKLLLQKGICITDTCINTWGKTL